MKLHHVIAFFAALVSLYGNAAPAHRQSDIVKAMIKDGCARPIADLRVDALPNFPKRCMHGFFSHQGVDQVLVPKRVKDWGSNGLAGKPWTFSDKSCEQFFVKLHQRIATYVPDVKLTPHDLFHGHVMIYQMDEDQHLAVLLHAKEYPSDLEALKNRYQLSQERFFSTDDSFKNRNFLYLSHLDNVFETGAHNEILVVNDEGICSSFFSGANTLSEESLRRALPYGKSIGDVNMFLPETLSRIKYIFHPGFDLKTGSFFIDYEAVETGKRLNDRMVVNQQIDSMIKMLGKQPLIYFLTGRN